MKKCNDEQIIAFMGILKKLGLTKVEICGLSSLINESDEMLLEIVDRLEVKDFKLTPQETMNICAQVIKENQYSEMVN